MTSHRDIRNILDDVLDGKQLSKDEALRLMEVDTQSPDMYRLLSASWELTRRNLQGRGEVYAQLGINFWPCPRNCGFCVFSSDAGVAREKVQFTRREIVEKAREMQKQGANAIFVMSTADYPFDRYIEDARAVRKAIGSRPPLVANAGDMNTEQVEQLVDAGFQGAYHVRRLREGDDTDIPPEKRLATLEAIRNSPLDLSYCVEPIGPEHSPQELVDEMLRGREYEAVNNACMRRTPVEGLPLAERGEISEWKQAKYVAITRLAAGDELRAMGVHEPSILALRAGANQIYAEAGPNPRDVEEETSEGRGRNVQECRRLLWEAGLEPLDGPTDVFRGNRS